MVMGVASKYEDAFFASRHERTQSSASTIVSLVLELAAPRDIRSVVDVGCGVGSFLREFQRCGASRVMGVDGEWVDEALLVIEKDDFLARDLATPLGISEVFDLAVSLEVAEHLPQHAARTFVGSLTQLAPLVVFSAAIPRQGGTHHVNEQWPSYWVRMFAECSYLPVDCIRRRIWDRPEVLPWYRQNTLIFVRQDSLAAYPLLAAEAEHDGLHCLSLVHPELFRERCDDVDRAKTLTLGELLRLAPGVLARSVRSRWNSAIGVLKSG